MKKWCSNCSSFMEETNECCIKCGQKLIPVNNITASAQPGESVSEQSVPLNRNDLLTEETPFRVIFSSLKNLLKGTVSSVVNVKKLIPVIILAVIWAVLIVLLRFDINTLPVNVVSYLTFAQGGVSGNPFHMAGGLIGKGISAYFIFSMILPVFKGQNPIKNISHGIKNMTGGLRPFSTKAFSLLLGAGFALIFYNFMAGNVTIGKSMAAITGLLLTLRAAGSKNGFLNRLFFSFMNKKNKKNKDTNKQNKSAAILAGMTAGFALSIPISVIPYGSIGYVFGAAAITAAIIIKIVNTFKKNTKKAASVVCLLFVFNFLLFFPLTVFAANQKKVDPKEGFPYNDPVHYRYRVNPHPDIKSGWDGDDYILAYKIAVFDALTVIPKILSNDEYIITFKNLPKPTDLDSNSTTAFIFQQDNPKSYVNYSTSFDIKPNTASGDPELNYENIVNYLDSISKDNSDIEYREGTWGKYKAIFEDWKEIYSFINKNNSYLVQDYHNGSIQIQLSDIIIPNQVLYLYVNWSSICSYYCGPVWDEEKSMVVIDESKIPVANAYYDEAKSLSQEYKNNFTTIEYEITKIPKLTDVGAGYIVTVVDTDASSKAGETEVSVAAVIVVGMAGVLSAAAGAAAGTINTDNDTQKGSSYKESDGNTTTTNTNPDGSSTTTYPDGSTSTASGNSSVTTTNDDGSTTTTNPDGTVIVTDPDGSITTTSTDGTTSYTDPNGYTTTHNPDGTVTYPEGTTTVNGDDGSTINTLPDGTVITENPDGSIEAISPDGTTAIKTPEGTSVQKNADGSVTVYNPDGTAVQTNPDGIVTVYNPDGTAVQTNADGSTTSLNADGSQTISDTDGSTTTLTEDGHMTIKDPDGTTKTYDENNILVSKTLPSGATGNYDSDGKFTGGTMSDGTPITVSTDGTVSMTIEGIHITIAPDGTKTGEGTMPDGTQIIFNGDDTFDATFPGGDTATIGLDGEIYGANIHLPDGRTVNIDPNTGVITITNDAGESAIINPDGSAVYNGPECSAIIGKDGSYTETYPDGSSVTLNPDGRINFAGADGTTIHANPDGTGTATQPDGTVWTVHSDGTTTVVKTDGTTIHANPDGTGIATQPDGTVWTAHSDGTTTVVKTDGTTMDVGKDGIINIKHPDGRAETILPENK